MCIRKKGRKKKTMPGLDDPAKWKAEQIWAEIDDDFHASPLVGSIERRWLFASLCFDSQSFPKIHQWVTAPSLLTGTPKDIKAERDRLHTFTISWRSQVALDVCDELLDSKKPQTYSQIIRESANLWRGDGSDEDILSEFCEEARACVLDDIIDQDIARRLHRSKYAVLPVPGGELAEFDVLHQLQSDSQHAAFVRKITENITSEVERVQVALHHGRKPALHVRTNHIRRLLLTIGSSTDEDWRSAQLERARIAYQEADAVAAFDWRVKVTAEEQKLEERETLTGFLRRNGPSAASDLETRLNASERAGILLFPPNWHRGAGKDNVIEALGNGLSDILEKNSEQIPLSFWSQRNTDDLLALLEKGVINYSSTYKVFLQLSSFVDRWSEVNRLEFAKRWLTIDTDSSLDANNWILQGIWTAPPLSLIHPLETQGVEPLLRACGFSLTSNDLQTGISIWHCGHETPYSLCAPLSVFQHWIRVAEITRNELRASQPVDLRVNGLDVDVDVAKQLQLLDGKDFHDLAQDIIHPPIVTTLEFPTDVVMKKEPTQYVDQKTRDALIKTAEGKLRELNVPQKDWPSREEIIKRAENFFAANPVTQKVVEHQSSERERKIVRMDTSTGSATTDEKQFRDNAADFRNSSTRGQLVLVCYQTRMECIQNWIKLLTDSPSEAVIEFARDVRAQFYSYLMGDNKADLSIEWFNPSLPELFERLKSCGFLVNQQYRSVVMKIQQEPVFSLVEAMVNVVSNLLPEKGSDNRPIIKPHVRRYLRMTDVPVSTGSQISSTAVHAYSYNPFDEKVLPRNFRPGNVSFFEGNRGLAGRQNDFLLYINGSFLGNYHWNLQKYSDRLSSLPWDQAFRWKANAIFPVRNDELSVVAESKIEFGLRNAYMFIRPEQERRKALQQDIPPKAGKKKATVVPDDRGDFENMYPLVAPNVPPYRSPQNAGYAQQSWEALRVAVDALNPPDHPFPDNLKDFAVEIVADLIKMVEDSSVNADRGLQLESDKRAYSTIEWFVKTYLRLADPADEKDRIFLLSKLGHPAPNAYPENKLDPIDTLTQWLYAGKYGTAREDKKAPPPPPPTFLRKLFIDRYMPRTPPPTSDKIQIIFRPIDQLIVAAAARVYGVELHLVSPEREVQFGGITVAVSETSTMPLAVLADVGGGIYEPMNLVTDKTEAEIAKILRIYDRFSSNDPRFEDFVRHTSTYASAEAVKGETSPLFNLVKERLNYARTYLGAQPVLTKTYLGWAWSVWDQWLLSRENPKANMGIASALLTIAAIYDEDRTIEEAFPDAIRPFVPIIQPADEDKDDGMGVGLGLGNQAIPLPPAQPRYQAIKDQAAARFRQTLYSHLTRYTQITTDIKTSAPELELKRIWDNLISEATDGRIPLEILEAALTFGESDSKRQLKISQTLIGPFYRWATQPGQVERRYRHWMRLIGAMFPYSSASANDALPFIQYDQSLESFDKSVYDAALNSFWFDNDYGRFIDFELKGKNNNDLKDSSEMQRWFPGEDWRNAEKFKVFRTMMHNLNGAGYQKWASLVEARLFNSTVAGDRLAGSLLQLAQDAKDAGMRNQILGVDWFTNQAVLDENVQRAFDLDAAVRFAPGSNISLTRNVSRVVRLIRAGEPIFALSFLGAIILRNPSLVRLIDITVPSSISTTALRLQWRAINGYQQENWVVDKIKNARLSPNFFKAPREYLSAKYAGEIPRTHESIQAEVKERFELLRAESANLDVIDELNRRQIAGRDLDIAKQIRVQLTSINSESNRQPRRDEIDSYAGASHHWASEVLTSYYKLKFLFFDSAASVTIDARSPQDAATQAHVFRKSQLNKIKRASERLQAEVQTSVKGLVKRLALSRFDMAKMLQMTTDDRDETNRLNMVLIAALMRAYQVELGLKALLATISHLSERLNKYVPRLSREGQPQTSLGDIKELSVLTDELYALARQTGTTVPIGRPRDNSIRTLLDSDATEVTRMIEVAINNPEKPITPLNTNATQLQEWQSSFTRFLSDNGRDEKLDGFQKRQLSTLATNLRVTFNQLLKMSKFLSSAKVGELSFARFGQQMASATKRLTATQKYHERVLSRSAIVARAKFYLSRRYQWGLIENHPPVPEDEFLTALGLEPDSIDGWGLFARSVGLNRLERIKTGVKQVAEFKNSNRWLAARGELAMDFQKFANTLNSLLQQFQQITSGLTVAFGSASDQVFQFIKKQEAVALADEQLLDKSLAFKVAAEQLTLIMQETQRIVREAFTSDWAEKTFQASTGIKAKIDQFCKFEFKGEAGPFLAQFKDRYEDFMPDSELLLDAITKLSGLAGAATHVSIGSSILESKFANAKQDYKLRVPLVRNQAERQGEIQQFFRANLVYSREVFELMHNARTLILSSGAISRFCYDEVQPRSGETASWFARFVPTFSGTGSLLVDGLKAGGALAFISSMAYIIPAYFPRLAQNIRENDVGVEETTSFQFYVSVRLMSFYDVCVQFMGAAKPIADRRIETIVTQTIKAVASVTNLPNMNDASVRHIFETDAAILAQETQREFSRQGVSKDEFANVMTVRPRYTTSFNNMVENAKKLPTTRLPPQSTPTAPPAPTEWSFGSLVTKVVSFASSTFYGSEEEQRTHKIYVDAANAIQRLEYLNGTPSENSLVDAKLEKIIQDQPTLSAELASLNLTGEKALVALGSDRNERVTAALAQSTAFGAFFLAQHTIINKLAASPLGKWYRRSRAPGPIVSVGLAGVAIPLAKWWLEATSDESLAAIRSRQAATGILAPILIHQVFGYVREKTRYKKTAVQKKQEAEDANRHLMELRVGNFTNVVVMDIFCHYFLSIVAPPPSNAQAISELMTQRRRQTGSLVEDSWLLSVFENGYVTRVFGCLFPLGTQTWQRYALRLTNSFGSYISRSTSLSPLGRYASLDEQNKALLSLSAPIGLQRRLVPLAAGIWQMSNTEMAQTFGVPISTGAEFFPSTEQDAKSARILGAKFSPWVYFKNLLVPDNPDVVRGRFSYRDFGNGKCLIVVPSVLGLETPETSQTIYRQFGKDNTVCYIAVVEEQGTRSATLLDAKNRFAVNALSVEAIAAPNLATDTGEQAKLAQRIARQFPIVSWTELIGGTIDNVPLGAVDREAFKLAMTDQTKWDELRRAVELEQTKAINGEVLSSKPPPVVPGETAAPVQVPGTDWWLVADQAWTGAEIKLVFKYALGVASRLFEKSLLFGSGAVDKTQLEGYGIDVEFDGDDQKQRSKIKDYWQAIKPAFGAGASVGGALFASGRENYWARYAFFPAFIFSGRFFLNLTKNASTLRLLLESAAELFTTFATQGLLLTLGSNLPTALPMPTLSQHAEAGRSLLFELFSEYLNSNMDTKRLKRREGSVVSEIKVVDDLKADLNASLAQNTQRSLTAWSIGLGVALEGLSGVGDLMATSMPIAEAATNVSTTTVSTLAGITPSIAKSSQVFCSLNAVIIGVKQFVRFKQQRAEQKDGAQISTQQFVLDAVVELRSPIILLTSIATGGLGRIVVYSVYALSCIAEAGVQIVPMWREFSSRGRPTFDGDERMAIVTALLGGLATGVTNLWVPEFRAIQQLATTTVGLAMGRKQPFVVRLTGAQISEAVFLEMRGKYLGATKDHDDLATKLKFSSHSADIEAEIVDWALAIKMLQSIGRVEASSVGQLVLPLLPEGLDSEDLILFQSRTEF